MSILDKLNNLKKASTVPARTPMSDAQVVSLKAKLRSENRVNVLPNSNDVKVPYRVAVNYRNEWSNHGTFTSIDVASAVGTLVSYAKFGDKAIQGEYDAEVAETHPEFITWIANPLNAEVIAANDSVASEEDPF